MPAPEFLTFSGVSRGLSPEAAARFLARHPGRFEWGVLVNLDQAADSPAAKYVPIAELEAFGRTIAGPKSLHLVADGRPETLPPAVVDALHAFDRVQINLPLADSLRLAERIRQSGFGGAIILPFQADQPPDDEAYQWLFDRSGGRGLTPSAWPRFETPRLCGFAGGLGPDTIGAAVAQIRTPRYWLDMETSLRVDGVFSLDRCETLLGMVFEGPATMPPGRRS